MVDDPDRAGSHIQRAALHLVGQTPAADRPTMDTTLPTVCQSCAGAMPVRYRWFGAPADCPHCLRATIPVLAPGTVYPPTGYELRFHDFVQLLRSGDRTVARFLADAFGYSVDRSAGVPLIMNDRQEAIEISWLHDRIQENVAQRREIHGIAMALWR